MTTLILLAEEGFQLRSKLSAWKDMASQWSLSSPIDHQMTIAWVFYSAISIYLSGTYDYSRLWSKYGILTPTLEQSEIQQHVNNILQTTLYALKQTNVSGLLFLFPLRIAGARGVTIEQRSQIHALLAEITNSFKAANAFTSDLEELWANPESKCNVTAEAEGWHLR